MLLLPSLLLLLILLPLASTSAPFFTCSAGPLTLTVAPPPALAYAVTLHGAPLLDGGAYAIHLARWLSAPADLRPASVTPANSTDAALGPATALAIAWATAPPLVTTFLCYPQADLLEFRAAFPEGVPASAGLPPGAPPPDPAFYNFNVSRAPSVHFPSFALGPGAPAAALGHVQWAGEFAFHASNWNVSLEGYESGQLGGPTVLHSAAWAPGAKPAACVLGTLAGHKDAIGAIVPDPSGGGGAPMRWAFGPHAHLAALPAGHAARLGLVAPRSAAQAAADGPGRLAALYPGDTGITAAVYAYGAALRALAGTRRFEAADDAGVSLLSAWTDNGAVMDGDFWALPGNAGRGGEVLAAWRGALAAAGVPAASLQLDPFWFARGSPGNRDWAPAEEVFGAGGFERALAAWGGATLYSFMWAAPAGALAPGLRGGFAFLESPVLANFMGGPFTRVAGNDSAGFYGQLMARCRAWGCVGHEVDFLDFGYFGFQGDMGVAGSWEAYLQGISAAGAAAGVPQQLCMPLPADVLLSAALPGVSNIRASDDDDLQYAGGGRWRIGLTSLLHGALDVRPYQDAVWTHACYSAPVPGPYPASYCQNATELGVAIGALSTGPLGLGDAVGFSNASLLAGALAANGVILKPSLPATPIDAYFNYGAGAGAGAGQPLPRSPLQRVSAEVWQAPSFVPVFYAAGGGAAAARAALAPVGRGGLGRYEVRARARRAAAAAPAPSSHTFPAATPCPYLSLLAVDVPLALNASLLPGDLTPSLATAAAAAAAAPGQQQQQQRSACNASGYVAMAAGLAAGGCAHGARALDCVARFDAAHALQLGTPGVPSDPLLRGGPHAHAVVALAPLLAQAGGGGGAGWVLLGEAGKFVAVSPVRFSGVCVQGGGGLTVAVEGAGGEVVAVRLLAPGSAGGLQAATVFLASVGPFPAGEGGTLLLACSGEGAGAACATSAA